VAEQAARLWWMSGGRDAVGFVTVLAELLGGLFTVALDQVVETAVGVVVGNPAGRFGRSLPEESQDQDGDGNQDQVAFLEGKSM